MIGGAYLCYEGAEKVYEALVPHARTRMRRGSARWRSTRRRSRTRRSRAPSRPISSSPPRSWRSRWRRVPEGGLLDPGDRAGRGRHRHHGRRLWRGGADREGRRCRRGAGGQRARSAIGSAEPRARPRAGARHAGLPDVLGVVGTAAMIWVGGGIIVHGLEAVRARTGSAMAFTPLPKPRLMGCRPLADAVEWLVTPRRCRDVVGS